jgi:hypothetical protein
VELIFGRGAFTDNFPLFGFDLHDYDALFVEKIGLFAELNAAERVSWSGRFRPPLRDAEIAPRPAQRKLPVWIGAGSPNSVVRAAALGYPLALPMVGRSLANYAQVAALYRRAWRESGRPESELRISTFAHLHVTETSRETREDFYAYYSAYLAPLFKGPIPPATFAQMLLPQGALVGGSPEEVVDKILVQHEAIGTTRFLGQIDIGGQPFAAVAKASSSSPRRSRRWFVERPRPPPEEDLPTRGQEGGVPPPEGRIRARSRSQRRVAPTACWDGGGNSAGAGLVATRGQRPRPVASLRVGHAVRRCQVQRADGTYVATRCP